MPFSPCFTFPIATCKGRRCLVIAFYDTPADPHGGVVIADFETGVLSKRKLEEVSLDTDRLMNIHGERL
jgi:hypothetical protein